MIKCQLLQSLYFFRCQGSLGRCSYFNFLSPAEMILPILMLALLFGSSSDIFTIPRCLNLSFRFNLTGEEMK